MDIECSYCYKPAIFFYKRKLDGRIYCCCTSDNKAIFKSVHNSNDRFIIIKSMKQYYTRITKQEFTNIMNMNGALE